MSQKEALERREDAMPAIFDEEGRAAMRSTMLAAGFDIMRERGVQHLTVSEVTRRSGIAKGTFYSFFPSKEEFVYQIVSRGRVRVAQELKQAAEAGSGTVDRAGFERWLRTMWQEGGQLYRAITMEGWRYLSATWPRERAFNPELDKETCLWILGMARDASPNANWKVLANLQKTLAMLYLNAENLHADALDETADHLLRAIVEEVFDS